MGFGKKKVFFKIVSTIFSKRLSFHYKYYDIAARMQCFLIYQSA